MQSFVVEIGAEIRCGQQKAEPSYPPENVCCLRLAIVRVSLWELIDVSLSGCLATEMTNVIFMKVSTSVSQATRIRKPTLPRVVGRVVLLNSLRNNFEKRRL